MPNRITNPLLVDQMGAGQFGIYHAFRVTTELQPQDFKGRSNLTKGGRRARKVLASQFVGLSSKRIG